MLNVEQSWTVVDVLLSQGLPVMLLTSILAVLFAISIIQILFTAFEHDEWLGIIMLIISPLMLFFYAGMAMFYAHIDLRELFTILLENKTKVSLTVSSCWGLWFMIAWFYRDLFAYPLARMMCVFMLYLISLSMLQQFELGA